MLIRTINRLLRPLHYTLKKENIKEGLQDIYADSDFIKVYEKVKAYTMTSPQRLYALYKSVEYVVKNNISGDFVECGVWRGGSSMAMAMVLKGMNNYSRRIFLYDTYEGMSEPSGNDSDIYGNAAKDLLQEEHRINNKENVWCYSTLDEVKVNLLSTGYPEEKIVFVKGKVEDTIPVIIPAEISLLRLDTDWYESTKHEMLHLYPLLTKGGVLIIDDYGHWVGARKAIDEYIKDNNLSLLLNRIDYTGRIAVKY